MKLVPEAVGKVQRVFILYIWT